MAGNFAHYRAKNRDAWNEAAHLHQLARGDLAHQLRHGLSTLAGIEVRELRDVDGLSVIHLQCNNGLDALSLARCGAKVLGVDFSNVAISEARMLSATSGIAATFVCEDIYDFETRERFDIVYTGKGALYWLPDLKPWASLIRSLLNPNGRVYVFEEHSLLPFLLELDPTAYNAATDSTFSYFHRDGPEESVGLDYVGLSGQGTCPAYEWQWTLGDIISSLAATGLHLDFLREWPCVASLRYWDFLEERDGAYYLPTDRPQLPLSFSLQFTNR